MRIEDCDYFVAGSGIAGLMSALHLLSVEVRLRLYLLLLQLRLGQRSLVVELHLALVNLRLHLHPLDFHLVLLLGSLGTAWTGVISFYFGSSASSQNKDQLLHQSTPIK